MKTSSFVLQKVAMTCSQKKIRSSKGDNFEKILMTYLAEKQNFG
jgi:hypothetical protein